MELVVNGDGINIRSGAGLEHQTVRKASKGDRYKVLAVKNVWYKVGNGVFAPYRNVTRAEFAALISNALQLPEGNKSFVDINKAHPSLHNGIKRSASAGIISGRGGGIFDPNAPITREEASVMIDKALQYKGVTGNLVTLPFTDQHLIAYKQPVQRLYSLQVVTGVGDNKFNPKGTTTRGEAAAFLVKMLDSMQK